MAESLLSHERDTFYTKISAICESYLQLFPEETDRLSALQTMIQKQDRDLRLRSTIPEGHICGSGVIISPDLSQILMVLHKKLGIWVVPGGHYDLVDSDPADTALRETEEETGYHSLQIHPWHTIHGIPLDIDTHPIPASPKNNEGAHVHYDFRYALVMTDEQPMNIQTEELLGFQWIPIEEVDPLSSIAPAVSKLHRLSQ